MSGISKFSSQDFSQVQEFLLAKDAKGILQNLKLAERYYALEQAVKLYAEKQCSAEEFLSLNPNWQAKRISVSTKDNPRLQNAEAARTNVKALKERVREISSEAEFTVRSKEIIEQIESLKSKGEALEREHAVLIQKKDEELIALSEELRDVKKGQTEANSRNESLSKELRGAQNATLALKKQMGENSRTIEGLQQQLREHQESSKSQILKQAETIARLGNELREVNAGLQASKLQASSLEGKVQELTTEKGRLEGEISSIQKKLETAGKDLEEALQKAEHQKASYSQEAGKLRENILELEKTNADLKADISSVLEKATSTGLIQEEKIAGFEKTMADLEKTNGKLSLLVGGLQVENKEQKAQLLQKDDEIAHLTKELQEKNSLIQTLKTMIENLQAIIRRLSEAFRDLATTLGIKLSISHKKGPTEEDIEKIAKAAQNAADQRSKAANQKAFDKLESTIASQVRALDVKDALIAEQEEKNIALQQRIEELMKEKIEISSAPQDSSSSVQIIEPAPSGKEEEFVVDLIPDSESEASDQQKVIEEQKLLIDQLKQQIERNRIATAKERLAKLERKHGKTEGKLNAIVEEEKKSSWFWWL